MPRTYVRKKIKKYSSEDLATAVEKVRNGELTQYGAAQAYKIPLTTIHEHVKNIISNPNVGRPTALLLEDEKKLAETITVMEKWGFGLSRSEIIELVAEYVRVNNIQTPFKNNTPGPDWFINFRKRHHLSIKKAQPVEYVRKKMTDPFIIAEYFDLLKKTLNELNLFDGPQFIWNLDETSLCLDPTRTKVVGQVNKPCARTTQGSGKENITVLAGANASGKKLPPLIVYKGKYVWDSWMADLNREEYDFEVTYAASTKGWMESDIFFNYMEKVLIPSVGEERPVLIIYDGHSTHVDVRVVELAIRNRITILKLPPHTSHLLQPLDISVFKSFKIIWDAKLVEWQRKNIGTKMPKNIFAKTLADTWQQTNPEVIKSGFIKAGIHPFNDKVIPVDVYDPEAYKRYQKMVTERDLAYTQLNLNTPKTLNQLCLDIFNKYLLTTNFREKSITDGIISLSLESKSDIENINFIAKYPTDLPIMSSPCHEQVNKSTQIQTQNSSNVNIISNIIIKEASVPPVKPIQVQQQRTLTFEELVLRKIQQDKKESTTTKKKRVTKGAEVITAADGKNILDIIIKSKDKKKTSQNTKKKITEIKKAEIEQTSSSGIQKKNTKEKVTKTKNAEIVQPGPSGLQKKNKRKRELSSSSTTSISDILSKHSDSDIIGIDDLDDLFDKYYDDETPKAENDIKKEKRTKLCKKSEDEILTYERSCAISSKGKGKGKRSKGKENISSIVNVSEVDEKDREKEEQELKIQDTVLVRYLIRNKWKYYIGFIEDIKYNEEEEETYYTVYYLKSRLQQEQLHFTVTKKKDIDKVPESLIVKKINIKRSIGNEKVYYLCNEEDAIYF